MGLLAPLYMAGLAALTLPLVLHLIRRTPRGRQAFSSLMFLTPSPPRLTRRSRLDHVLLLMLRLTALAVLALAFARPFLREAAVLPLDNLGSRRVAILLDTSASMRRSDLWQQAVSNVEGVLKDLGPKDDVALFTFDDRPRAIVEFAPDASEPTLGKADLVRQLLRTVAPTWGATDLAGAMMTVAGELESAADERHLASEPQLELITDLARGSRIDALQAYKWPDSVPVVAHVLSAKRSTNAAIQLLSDDEQTATREPRVRVTNAADSTSDQFFIGWQRSTDRGAGHKTDDSLATYVPTGQSRVIRLPRPTDDVSADRIVLHGDEAEFDNTFFVVPPVAQQVKVAWIGEETAPDTASPRFYFELAVADDPLREVHVESCKSDEVLHLDAASPPDLVVATAAVPQQSSAPLRDYVRRGGTLLVVLNNAAEISPLKSLLDDIELTEMTVGDE
ncbi:MAG TPA: BatA domain-containing protein, partial [Pirellulales bacterium]|nr:BatA domain-containing protein [Pirellulales bacterium]